MDQGGTMSTSDAGGRRTLSEAELEGRSPDGREGRLTEPRRVDKPWGYELIWAETDLYVGKILHVDEGECLSLQFHEEKDETIYVLRGSVRFRVGGSLDDLRDVVLEEGQAIRIVPGVIHRMEAVTDCDMLEASTPELDDVVRLQDRYGRAPEEAPRAGRGNDG
jgi:mannose-6-phosphate isomerase